MDPVPHQATARKLKISYDVCGLPSGTPYRGRIRLVKEGDFLKKVFGDKSKPVVVNFQDEVEGTAARRSRTFELGPAPSGTYTLELSVRDNRGRERKRLQSLVLKRD
jgi:hypothetical protein